MTPDAAIVRLGSKAGFTIETKRMAKGVARGIILTSSLPKGLSWSLDGGTGRAMCSISGSLLTCGFGDMWGGTSYTAHLSAVTVQAGTLTDEAVTSGASPLSHRAATGTIKVVHTT